MDTQEKKLSILVRIRGEAARRVMEEKSRDGIPHVATVEKALAFWFQYLDKMRDRSYPGVYTTANAPKGEGD